MTITLRRRLRGAGDDRIPLGRRLLVCSEQPGLTGPVIIEPNRRLVVLVLKTRAPAVVLDNLHVRNHLREVTEFQVPLPLDVLRDDVIQADANSAA